VEEVAALALQAYRHNARGRVLTVINGMDIFMLRGLRLSMATSANLAIMHDDEQMTHEVCTRIADYMNLALSLPDDELPLEVPLVFYSQRIHQHQHRMRGAFEYLVKRC